jgi:hypothetical protein
MGKERIQKNTSQTCLQASECCRKLSEFYQLPVGNGLPEALEGLCEVVLFAVKTAGFLCSGMTTQPATQDFTKASLPRLPGLLIVLRGSVVKQFEAEPSIGRVSKSIALDFAPT